jgi:PAS domain S-box-containing protein
MSEYRTSGIKYQELRSRVNAPFAAALLPRLLEGILMVDLEGVIQVANEVVLKLFGLEMQLTVGQRFWDVFSDDHFGFSMRESLRYGIPHRLIYKSFKNKELEITTSFLYEGPKNEHGFLLFIRDITHLQKLEQMVARADRMRELGEMAAKLAHEIRNSLGGIRGFASLLFRDLENQPHLQEMIHRILEGTKALEKLVTSVLFYARPVELSEQTLDLSQFLKQTSRSFKLDPEFPATIKFSLHIPNETILVPFDPDALKRALLNLLLNAVQAMEKGGELTLSLLKGDASCQISVSDTGAGMSDERRGSLFSPLFTTKSNGNGLGLVETQKIVQGHGGSIDVRSTLGRGTTFFITLPMKRCL